MPQGAWQRLRMTQCWGTAVPSIPGAPVLMKSGDTRSSSNGTMSAQAPCRPHRWEVRAAGRALQAALPSAFHPEGSLAGFLLGCGPGRLCTK